MPLGEGVLFTTPAYYLYRNKDSEKDQEQGIVSSSSDMAEPPGKSNERVLGVVGCTGGLGSFGIRVRIMNLYSRGDVSRGSCFLR
jgi:hypothetical protein